MSKMPEIKNLDSLSKFHQDEVFRFLVMGPTERHLEQFSRNRTYRVTFNKKENCYYIYKIR